MAANASPRAQRAAVMATHLGELPSFVLAIDCLGPWCAGERTYSFAELARFYGPKMTVAQTLHRMRCKACGQKPPRAAWLLTGPSLNQRIRPKRVPLMGPDARD